MTSSVPSPPPNYSITLAFNLHFWSGKDDLLIRETDFGVFRFYDKQELRDVHENYKKIYAQDKISYASLRGHQVTLDNKTSKVIRSSGGKLRNSLRELELLLAEKSVLFSKWRSSVVYQIILNNGLIINMRMNKLGDIDRIVFDKFFVGKLPDGITGVSFSSKFLIFSFLEPRIAVITFSKDLNFQEIEQIDKHEPKINWVELGGPPGRRLRRQTCVSEDLKFLLVWWSISDHEVFPWTPNLSEEDRANVFLFSLTDLRNLGYLKTHSDPISFRFVDFDQTNLTSSLNSHPQCVIHYLGQETSRRGEMSLENSFLHPAEGDRQLRKKNHQKLPLGALVTCSEVMDHHIILGCTDGNILVYDYLNHNVDCQTKAHFIPYVMKGHPDKALFVTASEKGIVQCFDLALTPIRLQFSHNDQLSSSFLDLSQYFRTQMSLVQAEFCSKCPELTIMDRCPMANMASNYLLFRFHGGPLVLAQIYGSVFSSGSLGPIQLTSQYLRNRQIHPILRLLNQLNWSQSGQTILTCMTMTFNKLMKSKFSRENEMLMELCLGLFFTPLKPISDEILDEFSEPVHDLSRRFFHHLIRHNQLVKAFQLAVDINDYDLFMDLYHSAIRMGDIRDLAEAALIKAKTVFHEITESEIQDQVSNSDDNSLPPPPPTPPPNSSKPKDPPLNPSTRSTTTTTTTFKSLPSPMQLFSSAVTTVEVEHHPGAGEQTDNLQPPLAPHFGPSDSKSTAAKTISTTEFKKTEISVTKPEETPSFISLPPVSVSLEEAEDIKVIHFGLV